MRYNETTVTQPTKHLETLFVIILFGLASLLFAFRVDFSALQSYDEAWYGAISRSVTLHGNPFLLQFNGRVFTDHPPLGFWLMAIPSFIFGSTEFSVRLLSVLTGAGSGVLVYLIGKHLKSRSVGVSAVLILFSMMWFVFRTRSGNLDVPFVFFELLTLLAALRKDRWQIYVVALSFAGLVLTKTLVGVGLLPVILYLVYKNREQTPVRSFLQASLLGLGLVLPWYFINQWHDSSFLFHHFVEIGTRGENNQFELASLAQSLEYLAIGVGKWYKLFWLSLVLGPLLWWRQAKTREALSVFFLWFAGFSVFFFSSKTEVWHLLPVYPVIAILIPFTLFWMADFFSVRLQSILKPVMFLAISGLSLLQFWQFSNLLYLQEPAFSAEKDVSLKAQTYSPLYLLDTFYPAAVYYSEQVIDPLHWQSDAYQQLSRLLSSSQPGYFIINKSLEKKLTEDRVPFNVVDSNASYLLITAETSR